MSFNEIINIPGSKADASVLKGWWWYYVAVRKEHLMAINGVDEKFMEGMTGEDDNFALRMSHSGVPLFREHGIVGIHQDHTANDKKDIHAFRFDKRTWKQLRDVSHRLSVEWARTRDPVANRGIEWGTYNAIIKEEIF